MRRYIPNILEAGSLLIILLVAVSSCHKDTTSYPQGWRAPINSELGDDWRKKDAEKYLVVKGDFNGDAVTDEARLLVRADGSALGFFGFVSDKNHAVKTYLLDEMKGAGAIHAMGIKKVSPGLYKTACGKGYWTCRKPDEVPEIKIQHDAIDYFKTESANSFFYWDVQAHAFKRIWISD
jgi:hypothetical protein